MQNKSLKINFSAAPFWEARLETFGKENSVILIIDNFIEQPEQVFEYASLQKFSALAPYYPGVRAAAPIQYMKPVMPALNKALVDLFSLSKGVSVQECFFSLTTTKPEDLVLLQRHPHIDGGDDGKIAILHYLCDETHGGTAFYRHRSTGFETVPNDRFADYKRALGIDVEKHGMPPAAYFYESDEKFEKIFEVSARFNRTVIYKGVNLHSVNVGPNPNFSHDPSKGRLTTNLFINPIKD